MKVNHAVLLALSILSSVPSAFARGTTVETIQVSSTVPSDQVARIQADINYLKSLNFSNADADMLKLMEMNQANPQALLDWLEARVHYIIDEKLDLKSSISIANSSYEYPNPSVIPDIETATATPADNGAVGTVTTVMLNLGGGLYLAGKENGMLLQLNIPGIGNRTVTSPRTGILKVGAGLFAKLFQDASLTPDSKPYIALRLSTLFHEARHSDGNGKSLGFLHAVCPSGSYKGYSACDRNLNGPYQLETKFTNSLINACSDCSAGDKKAMQALAADAASRQITFTPDTSASVDQETRLKVLQMTMDTCNLFTQMHLPAPTSINCDLGDIQRQMDAIKAGTPSTQGTASTMWDPTPENI